MLRGARLENGQGPDACCDLVKVPGRIVGQVVRQSVIARHWRCRVTSAARRWA